MHHLSGTVYRSNVLDRFKRVIYANSEAEAILRQGHCVHSVHGRLMFDDPDAGSRFQDALDNVLAFPSTTQEKACWTFRTRSREGGRRLLEVLVRPVRCTPYSGLVDHTQIAVYLVDPSHADQPSSDVLAGLYHLTRAEARCAESLCEGESINSFVEKSKLSSNTVRTHLRSIFLKTGARRQGELVALLIRNVAAIAALLRR